MYHYKILAIGENKGIDNPLAFVGCKHLLRVCAGIAYLVCVLPSSGSINFGS